MPEAGRAFRTPRLLFADFEVDLRARELRRNGAPIHLQEQPFHVLAVLLEHAGEVVTREDIRLTLWPSDIFVDFDNSLNTAINKIREALDDSAEDPHFIETLPRRGYRFIAPVEGQRASSRPAPAAENAVARAGFAYRLWGSAAAAVFLLALLGSSYWERQRSAHRLTEKHTLVLADFVNRTGDPVFDDTVKQALLVALQQSPFLNILSEQQVRETLKLMGRSPAEGINDDVAQEVCVRTGSTAVLLGSIAPLGSQYVISLNATSCRTGDRLGQEQAQAPRKEEVLKALDQATTRLRSKLGESLSSVQKYDTPLEQATTPSLEAFRAYSLAEKIALEKDESASIPFFEHAIELDPNFALAYAELGARYFDIGESGPAAENLLKAYQLSDRVSDYERWWISDLYYKAVTGELGKAKQLCLLWAETYPLSGVPHDRLALEYEWMGQYEDAVAEGLKAMRLDPGIPVGTYSNLMEDYSALDNLTAAKTTYRRALERGFESPFLHADMYGIAFVEGDRQEMQRQVTWATGKPGAEDWLLSLESDTHAFYGDIGIAREFSRRAVETARRNDQIETAALWQMNAALRAAEFGYPEQARRETDVALAMASARDVQILAALALARVGDSGRAQSMAQELERRFPASTVLNNYWLPTIRASNEIHRGKPAEALRILELAAPYELGYPEPQFQDGGVLYPVYVRGHAYLLLHQGKQAGAEFQKLLAHRGIVLNSPLAALARLGLARAFTLQGDAANARAAYQDFLTLWKDADPDIPILIAAKAENAKLQ